MHEDNWQIFVEICKMRKIVTLSFFFLLFYFFLFIFLFVVNFVIHWDCHSHSHPGETKKRESLKKFANWGNKTLKIGTGVLSRKKSGMRAVKRKAVV